MSCGSTELAGLKATPRTSRVRPLLDEPFPGSSPVGHFSCGSATHQENVTRPTPLQRGSCPVPVMSRFRFRRKHRADGNLLSTADVSSGVPVDLQVPSRESSPVPRVPSYPTSPVPTVQSRPNSSVPSRPNSPVSSQQSRLVPTVPSRPNSPVSSQQSRLVPTVPSRPNSPVPSHQFSPVPPIQSGRASPVRPIQSRP